MEEEVRTIKRTCDICGKMVENFALVSEAKSQAIIHLYIKTWYGGTRKHDICQDCSDEIIKTIEKIAPPNTLTGQCI